MLQNPVDKLFAPFMLINLTAIMTSAAFCLLKLWRQTRNDQSSNEWVKQFRSAEAVDWVTKYWLFACSWMQKRFQHQAMKRK